LKKTAFYTEKLKALDDWDEYLLRESGLPGPRGNLELAHAAADEGDLKRFEHFLSYTPDLAPTNDPHEFLAFCGVVGLGRLAAGGQSGLIERLRPYASDPRWRIREATAMALQRVGERDRLFLLSIVRKWAEGNWLEKRAVVATLAEPRLLKDVHIVWQALDIFDQITTALAQAVDRKTEDFRVLRQGLGYAWSVLVAADPQAGKPRLEHWFTSSDTDIRWVMRENLKKARLTRMDLEWVSYWRARL
jgi:hypothetical protein